MEFNRIEIDEFFTFMGWKFQKKTSTTAKMLSNGKIKTFFQHMPVQPEENNDCLQAQNAERSLRTPPTKSM